MKTKHGFICILCLYLELEVKNTCNEIFIFISLVAGVIDTITVSNLKLTTSLPSFNFKNYEKKRKSVAKRTALRRDLK
jgi:hypothetical protein